MKWSSSEIPSHKSFILAEFWTPQGGSSPHGKQKQPSHISSSSQCFPSNGAWLPLIGWGFYHGCQMQRDGYGDTFKGGFPTSLWRRPGRGWGEGRREDFLFFSDVGFPAKNETTEKRLVLGRSRRRGWGRRCFVLRFFFIFKVGVLGYWCCSVCSCKSTAGRPVGGPYDHFSVTKERIQPKQMLKLHCRRQG